MYALDCNLNKKNLLDLLAYVLWEENTANELSDFHIRFGQRLYKEILQELKGQAQQWRNSTYQDSFGDINLECQDLGNLFFLEKRLEMIEQRLEERTEMPGKK